MTSSVDKILANHCAPVLLGKKPGALFTLSVGARALQPYAKQLAVQGVYFAVVSERRGRSQIFVYRPQLLRRALEQDTVQALLLPLGYPVAGSITEHVRHLKSRLAEKEFPHEVGIFLGYPIEDVQGFVENKGRDYKLCGLWKVYGDVREAQQTFAMHEECRRRLVQFVENGGSVCRMCAAASAV